VQDFMARLVAQGISAPLGRPVVVENRPSNLTGEIVAKAPPDGYTLLVAGGTFMAGPLLEKRSYDPVADFSPISLLAVQPSVLVVHPSLPVKSVKDLIALAKAKPGMLNYASSGAGSQGHVAGELFKAMTDVNMVRIPYKSSTQLLADLAGGHVEITFGNLAMVTPHLKSGRLRALAITGNGRSPLYPELPPLAATVPGYQAVSRSGMLAPAKTPAAIIRRLNQEIVRVLNIPDTKERMLSMGVEAVGSTPEQYATLIKTELSHLAKVIKEMGITAE
jgi:tripartite-type tricarboxylate transporter receptor subunit TctC